MIITPCLDCEKRSGACWGYCQTYLAWKEKRHRELESLKPTDADAFCAEGVARATLSTKSSKCYGKKLKGVQH